MVAAYVNREPTDLVMTESLAQAELNECRDRLRHVEEIESALRAESDEIENKLEQRHYAIADAAGKLLSRSPEFINLTQRMVYDSYRNLRDFRVMVSDLQRLVHIDDHLMQLIDNSQPCDRSRRRFYDNDDAMIATWTTAIAALLTNGDAFLPGDSNRIPRDDDGNSSAQPVRGGATPRQRARAARSSLPAAPAVRRKRRSGSSKAMTSIRRAALARERDASGRFQAKEKGGGGNRPPQ